MGKTMKKILVMLLVCVLVITSCKSKEEASVEPVQAPLTEEDKLEEVDEAKVADPISTVEEEDTGFDLSILKKEPIWKFDINHDNGWSSNEPFFNPMGPEEAYSDVYFEENTYIDLSYMSRDKNLVERYVYGDYHNMSIDFDENLSEMDNRQFLSDIKNYIEAIGGQVKGIEQDQTVFMVIDDQDNRWWGKVEVRYETIEIELIKETELKANETLTIKTDEAPNPLYISSYQSGDYYQRLFIDTDGGYTDVKITTTTRYGDYYNESHVGIYLDEEVGSKYLLGNLPLTPSYSQYEIYWEEDQAPSEIVLLLEESIELQGPTMSEEMGAIKVSAAYVSDVYVTATNRSTTYIDHPEFYGEEGIVDQTPDGDFMIFVPSGYWDVHMSLADASVIGEYATVGVPVNTGEMTEIKVPYTMAASMSQQSSGYNARGVEIGKIKESEASNEVSFYFTMLDDKTKAIPPTTDNTKIYESSQMVEVTSIKHVDEPPKIVLLLDSSGSMKGQLTQVKNAAKDFVEGLPEESEVIVVDFDSDVKVFSSTSQSDAIANIGKITVGGNTALYDALKEAANYVDSNDRGTIVLFTDGENDLAGQEVTTKEEVEDLLEGHGVPVYAIGYGEGHDGKTINDFAKISQGLYFDAQDSTALGQVFDSIHERIGSTYIATYKRPSQSGFGDVPVISFMVDTSGSMEEVDEGAGQRMNNVKNLLSPFIVDLPEETLVEISGFTGKPYVIQSLTDDKRKLLQGISAIESGGSTEIPQAVVGGWLSLKHVPSTKKVMIFITDEAMEPADPMFIEAVDNLNKEGIEVLWVGLGLDEVSGAFASAAELSNSDYVVTSDVDTLREAFDKVLEKVKSLPPNDQSQISIEIEKENSLGAREEYGDSTIVQLSPKKISNEEASIALIKESYGEKISQYDPEIAQKLIGFAESDKETIITGRVKVGKEQRGDAALIKVEEVVYMSKLYGVDSPSGYRFVGIETGITNIMKEQEVMIYPDGSNHPSAFVAGGGKGELVTMIPDYLIPDYRSHLFLTVNREATYPASDATWLSNEPIVIPGNPEIYLEPKKEEKGMLVFVVPDDAIQQLSLHLYDTVQGGVGVPIIGEMPVTEEMITQMPEEAGTSLADTFSVQIIDVKDDLEFVEEENSASFYRAVEGLLTSEVNALLELEPTERIHLSIPTNDGEFWFDLHNATSLVPFGHYQKRQLAPGSNNKLVWIYELPETIKTYESNLDFELAGDDVRLNVTKGDTLSMSNQVLYQGQGEGFELRIHDVYRTGHNSGFLGEGMLVVDLTIEDEKDGFSTQGIPELFYWEGDQEGLEEPYSANLSWLSDEMICGMNDNSIVYDGTTRRGFLIYQPSTYDDAVAWQLKSSLLDDLEIVSESGDIDTGLAVAKTEMVHDENFEMALVEAVYEKVERYEGSNKSLEAIADTKAVVAQTTGDHVPVPRLSSYGETLSQKVRTIADVKDILKDLRYIPSDPYSELFMYSYSMEATLAQGFGTEHDYANVALTLLKGLGLKAKETKIEINEQAQNLLAEMSGVEVTRTELPGVTFYDGDEEHVWVLPFVEDLDDLVGYCYYSRVQGYENQPRDGILSISFEVEPLNPDRNAQMDQMSGALAGDTDGGPILYLEEVVYRYISESEMSLGAIDIGFVEDNHVLKTYMLRVNGIDWVGTTINLNDYNVRAVHVKADVGGEVYKHRTPLYGGRSIENVFLTIGLNTPDLSEEARSSLSEMRDTYHNSTDEPSDLSALRWYGRNLMTQFIEGQSLYEKELAETLDLVIGRTDNKRMVVVSMKAPVEEDQTQKFEASIDLVNCFNDVHNGEDEALHAFNILSGLYMTNLEMEILGEGGYGAFEIMNQTPDGTDMVIMKPNLDSEDTDQLLDAGLPPHIIEYMLELDQMILMPNKPAIIDGVERWAWFEIDPHTFETIGVMDTFERGAMVSNVIIDTVKNSGQFMIGGFVGISSSIWAVSAVSLQETDYKKILEEAKKFALGMKDSFGIKQGKFSMGVGGKPTLSQSFGFFKYSFDGKGAFKQNIVGFTQGYEAGVNYYFDQAE